MNCITFLDIHQQKWVGKKTAIGQGHLPSSPFLFTYHSHEKQEQNDKIPTYSQHNSQTILGTNVQTKNSDLEALLCISELCDTINLKENCQICSHENLHSKYELIYWTCLYVPGLWEGNLSWKWPNTFQICEPKGGCEKVTWGALSMEKTFR